MFLKTNKIMIVYPIRSGSPKAKHLYIQSGNTFVPTTDTTFQSGTTYYIAMGDYILEAKFGYHKLWAKDSGRNLAGTQSGTLLGIFPKITMQFRKLDKDEIELLAPVFDSSYQTTVYYDPNKKANTTMTTYSNDWELTNKSFIDESQKNEGFSWAVISTRKRS